MKYKLTIDGKTYEVDIEPAESDASRPDLTPQLGSSRHVAGAPPPLSAAPPPTSGAQVDETKVCRSPIAGVVVRVSAEVGQAIHSDDVLMVLEAMKMETTITSPIAGKIARVSVTVGDPVQGGQVLVEFE